MTVKGKNVVIKLPGAVVISGPPVFVGRMPVRAADADSPEAKELLEDLQTVLKAGNENN